MSSLALNCLPAKIAPRTRKRPAQYDLPVLLWRLPTAPRQSLGTNNPIRLLRCMTCGVEAVNCGGSSSRGLPLLLAYATLAPRPPAFADIIYGIIAILPKERGPSRSFCTMQTSPRAHPTSPRTSSRNQRG